MSLRSPEEGGPIGPARRPGWIVLLVLVVVIGGLAAVILLNVQ
jgi:hypothetical protein